MPVSGLKPKAKLKKVYVDYAVNLQAGNGFVSTPAKFSWGFFFHRISTIFFKANWPTWRFIPYTRDSLAIYPFSLGIFFQILLPFAFTEQFEFWFENLYPRISEDTFSIKKSLKRNLWAKKSLKRNLWKKSTRRISQEQPFQEISLPKVASWKIYPKNSEENKEKSSTKRSLRRNLYQRILDDQFSTKSFLKRKLHSKNPSIRSTQYLYQGLFANHLPKNALTKISSKTNQKSSSPDFLPRKMSSKVSLIRNPCQKTA